MRHVSTAPLPPAPGTDAHAGIALANTLVMLPGEQPWDGLATPEAATAWLVSHDLAPGDTELLAYCQSRLTSMRSALRALFTARVRHTAPAPEDLETVNQALARVPSAPLLHHDPQHGFQRAAEHPVTRLVEYALARIADDAAHLLSDDAAGALAQCESAPCDRFMLRNHGRRRWCSTRCGDRVRAARSYARRKVG